MRKRALAICLCIVLALVSVGATIAYFTDDDSAVNTFTVGKVEIELYEMTTDENGIETGDYDKNGNEYKLIPGKTYSKEPFIRLKSNSEPCWLYVTVDNDIAEAGIEGTPTVADQMTEKYYWEPIGTYTIDNKTQTVYARQGVASTDGTNDKDFLVFGSFTINGDAADNDKIAACEDKAITIKAYAIQAAGFDTAKKAWDAAYKQFATN